MGERHAEAFLSDHAHCVSLTDCDRQLERRRQDECAYNAFEDFASGQHERLNSGFQREVVMMSLRTPAPAAVSKRITVVAGATALVRRAAKSASTFIALAAIAEFVAVCAAAYAGVVIYHSLIGWSAADQGKYYASSAFLSVAILLITIASRHFGAFQTRTLNVVLANAFGTVILSFALMLSAMFLFRYADEYSRGSFALQFIFVCAVVLGGRAMLFSRLKAAANTGFLDARRVVLVGDPSRSGEILKQLKPCGVEVIHISPPFTGGDATANSAAERLFVDSCRLSRTHDILIALGSNNWKETVNLANLLSELPVGLHIVPSSDEAFLSTAQILSFGEVTTIQVARPPLTIADRSLKRAFDIFAAASGLLMLAPLFAMVAIAIKLDSPGPVFYRQQRRGYNKQPISVVKFRSMNETENCSQVVKQAKRNDPRITRVGRVLRGTNIDELPQLINVLVGEMSIVGPRPHAMTHDKLFETLIPPYSRRHRIKPGISGWAQVNGYRGETDTLEKMQKRVDYDLHYIENWSFWFDIKIIFLTVFTKKAYSNAY